MLMRHSMPQNTVASAMANTARRYIRALWFCSTVWMAVWNTATQRNHCPPNTDMMPAPSSAMEQSCAKIYLQDFFVDVRQSFPSFAVHSD
jgi:hypothetical protein